MSRVVRTITPATVLSCHLVNTVFILYVGSAARIVRIRSADEQTIVALLGQNSDVVVAIIFRLALHQAQLRVPVSGVPLDPLFEVLLQVVEADVVHDVPGPDEERSTILAEEFEVVGVGLVTEECLHVV